MKKKAALFKKGTVILGTSLLAIGGPLTSLTALAQEQSAIYVIDQEPAAAKPETPRAIPEPFVAKTAEERAALPESEQALINEIERLLKEEVNLSSRSLTEDALNRFAIDTIFGIAFERYNPTFETVFNLIGMSGLFEMNPGGASESAPAVPGPALPEKPLSNWFNKLTNTETRTLETFETASNKTIYLKAQYIDNQSDKTVVLHHGYRSMFEDMLPQAKFFSEAGYNVLLPDARSHGKSEGEYISFGHFEQEDLTGWINQEVAGRPTQDLYLYGGSMGAVTVTMSQKKRHPNVKAVIEDCGFTSFEEQFRSVMRLITDQFAYIPIVNQFNWYGKETQLLELLNNRHLKPTLGFDIFTANTPLASVKESGVPQLFTHGDADWLIKPSEMNTLYDNAIGYKEKLIVPGAGHGEAFAIAGDAYKEKVLSFFATVDAMDSLAPIVVDDVNLLKNVEFNSSQTGITDWLTSINSTDFTANPLTRNNYSEFVLEKKKQEDIGTVVGSKGDLTLFNRYSGPQVYLGQHVKLVEGETYELTLAAQSKSNATYTFPNVMYGLDDQVKEDSLKEQNKEAKKMIYTAPKTGDSLVKLGARIGYHSWVDKNYTHTTVNDVRLINNDRTPPKAVTIDRITTQTDTITLTGKAEANSTVVIKGSTDAGLAEAPVAANGAFAITIEKQDSQSIYHLVNVDTKGNSSASKVLYFN